MAQEHFTQPKTLSRTPYNFFPGELSLIAYAALRFACAARYHAAYIPPCAMYGDEDLLAEYHANRSRTAWRRMIHFGWYCVDIENGQREVTRQKIDRDRAEFFEPTGTYGYMLFSALSVLGFRYLTANHLNLERW